MADDEDFPQSNEMSPPDAASNAAGDAPNDVMIEPVPKDIEARKQIEAHIERFLDKPALVTQELAPVEGGIDLHILPPTMLYPFFSLVTVGMSDIAMPAPPGAETFRYAELLLALPRTWPMSTPAWKREENYWPIRCLRALARMPFLRDAWVGPGYTVSHGGEPPHPYARATRLCGAFVTPPMRYETDFLAVVIRPEKVVRFHAVIPLYREELAFRYEAGPRALRMRLTEHGVTELLAPRRKNVLARRWFGRG